VDLPYGIGCCHQCNWQANCRSCDAKWWCINSKTGLFLSSLWINNNLAKKLSECGHTEIEKPNGLVTEKNRTGH